MGIRCHPSKARRWMGGYIVAKHTDSPDVFIWDVELQPNRHPMLGASNLVQIWNFVVWAMIPASFFGMPWLALVLLSRKHIMLTFIVWIGTPGSESYLDWTATSDFLLIAGTVVS
ncbi:hypothetical protein OPV22_014153 [Ensete ventricosum]|uniref:Uncharacterized protein n=1 Tax=Ensete ventricosum TaxID=4639 RepID=A0AAV8RAW4_ENSVE|nr:hypothetical protein OPV22_014153 [Ensete ventricosum]